MLHNCTYCDYKTTVKANLRRHIQNKHGNNKNGVRMNSALTTVSEGYDTACNKCGETAKFYYCGHCNYTTKRKYNLKGHMERKHSPILNQEDVDQDITGVKAHIPFTQPEILNVKDEVKNQELLEDSIEVLKIYKLLQRMKNK